MQKFSDAEFKDYATRVLALLKEQREYFKAPCRPKLEKCKKLEKEMWKLTEGVLGEFDQLRIFENVPVGLPD